MRRTVVNQFSLALITASILVRLLPHPANFTPLGATALFGGAKLGRPWNYIMPPFILFVTDLFLGFHRTMPYVYGSFLLTTALGEKIIKPSTPLYGVALLSAVSSTLFFLITNFGVWAAGELYPKTLTGLETAYIMGLPFYRNMLAADLLFGLGFFAVFHAVESGRLLRQLGLLRRQKIGRVL